MEDKRLYDIAKDALNESELNSADIPNIDLYVDQILNLVSTKLLEGSERFHERQLTKTMINNYSKDGIITPIKGKKYTKEQILQILTVYTLKNTLTINEIKRLILGAYEADDFDGEELRKIYDRHLEIKKVNKQYAVAALEGIVERNSFDINDDSDYISTICALVSLSAQLKNIAQAMIDEKFPEPVDTEEEDKDKEKEKEKKEKDKDKDKDKEKKEKKENKEKDKDKDKDKDKKKKKEAVSESATAPDDDEEDKA